MRSEITIGINFKQALIFKHSLENMINVKESRLNQLIGKDFKSEDEKREAYKIKKDIIEEVEALSVVNVGLDIFHDNGRREKEVREYAQKLPTLLEEVERHNRNL